MVRPPLPADLRLGLGPDLGWGLGWDLDWRLEFVLATGFALCLALGFEPTFSLAFAWDDFPGLGIVMSPPKATTSIPEYCDLTKEGWGLDTLSASLP